jgi:hypothetical protein
VQGHEQARFLLRVLACLDNAVSVPALLLDRDVLGAAVGGSGAVQDGSEALLAVGLITLSRLPDNDSKAGVKIHPLVALTIRRQAGSELPLAAAVAVRMLTAVTNSLNHEQPENTQDWFDLVPHLLALLRGASNLSPETDAQLGQSAARISLALLWAGSDAASLTIAESALTWRSNLAEDHPVRLELRERRAGACQSIGRYVEAEAEYKRAFSTPNCGRWDLVIRTPLSPATISLPFWLRRAGSLRLTLSSRKFSRPGSRFWDQTTQRRWPRAMRSLLCWLLRVEPLRPNLSSGRSSGPRWGSSDPITPTPWLPVTIWPRL